MGLQPCVYWFTGLSGSGKSTLAEALCENLKQKGVKVEYLDGDTIRGIFPETGFTKEEREKHLKWVGFIASRMEAQGIVVVASFVSPYRSSREFVRKLCHNFFEIYVSTPLEECEKRDVKGLYAKARRGEIKNFTGVSDPYEPSPRPELNLDTTKMTVAAALNRVLELGRT